MFDELKRDPKRVFNNFFDTPTKSVSPDEIIEKAVDEAKAHAKVWGEGNKADPPNVFDVYINTADWREYYSKDAERKARRMAAMLLERLDSEKYAMVSPRFTLCCSPNPDMSTFEVHASFGGSEERGEWKGEFKKGGGKGPNGTERLNERDAHSEHSNMGLNDAETEMLGGTHVMARLIQGQDVYLVENRFRVGANRETDDPADILLPSEGNKRTSRDHGAFFLNGPQWVYENHGANGTRVEKADGSVNYLGVNEWLKLADGDVLFFATEEGYRFSLGS